MPDTTPIYTLPYPCTGEVVDPDDFADLGTAIDTVLDAVDADLNNALNRYNVDISGNTQVIPVNVDTTLLTPQYTFPVAGLWLVRAQVVQTSAPTTINMMRTRILPSLGLISGQTANTEGNQGLMRPWGAAPIVAPAASTVAILYQWNGTGSQTVQGFLSARLLARIA